jgi:hypothetical protein
MATTPSSHRLSPDQQAFYHENGYLLGLPPIYTREEMAALNAELPQLLALLEPGETTKDIREWHETSTYLFEICMNPKILDLVESVLGPDFYCWASNFFIKDPRSPSTVGWHQDAYYWPMAPHHSVTVWLAFDDVDAENGGMKLIPGSHRGGLVKHRRSTETNSVLTLELEDYLLHIHVLLGGHVVKELAPAHDIDPPVVDPARPELEVERYLQIDRFGGLLVNGGYSVTFLKGVLHGSAHERDARYETHIEMLAQPHVGHDAEVEADGCLRLHHEHGIEARKILHVLHREIRVIRAKNEAEVEHPAVILWQVEHLLLLELGRELRP